jgi:hypothetical protein
MLNGEAVGVILRSVRPAGWSSSRCSRSVRSRLGSSAPQRLVSWRLINPRGAKAHCAFSVAAAAQIGAGERGYRSTGGRVNVKCGMIGSTPATKHRSVVGLAERREERTFTANSASSCAREVVHHDPATPRIQSLVPEDRVAADAGVMALSAELQALPASIRNALANAESSAGHISEDRLQGLAELIQNSDDLGATFAEFTFDEKASRLMFRHNGSGLTLHDVWALAIPWLSLKVDDPDQLGRFGIGLKTLHALSDVLEVHQRHFRVRYEAHDLAVATSDVGWLGAEQSDAMTTFVIPVETDDSIAELVASWLARWSDAGLVFLTNLSMVTLRGPAGEVLAKLHVNRTAAERVEATGLEMGRRIVTASDTREWVVYSRSVPAPKGRTRARKAQAKHTPIAVAFSLSGSDVGHIHVGLLVRPIGLPLPSACPVRSSDKPPGHLG